VSFLKQHQQELSSIGGSIIGAFFRIVLSMLPSAVFYLLVQDKIIEGVAAGAVKG